jgi:hypothetical protein
MFIAFWQQFHSKLTAMDQKQGTLYAIYIVYNLSDEWRENAINAPLTLLTINQI